MSRIAIDELLKAADATATGDVSASTALYVAFPVGKPAQASAKGPKASAKTFEARNKTIVLEIDDEGFVVGLELV